MSTHATRMIWFGILLLVGCSHPQGEAGTQRSESAEPKPATASPDIARALAEIRHMRSSDRFTQQVLASNEADWSEVPELLRRAEQGDMNSAAALGTQLVRCINHHDPVELDRKLREALENAHAKVRQFPGRLEVDIRNAESSYLVGMQTHEACTAIGGAQVAKYHIWLERAARAGVASAASAYVEHAMKEFDGRSALIANVEEAARRRTLARSWMEQILRQQGNPHREERLRQYVGELTGQGNRLFAADRNKALTYEYVLQMAVAQRMESNPRTMAIAPRIAGHGGQSAPGSQLVELWRNGPYKPSDITATQWAQIVEEGREIYRRDFGPPPQ